MKGVRSLELGRSGLLFARRRNWTSEDDAALGSGWRFRAIGGCGTCSARSSAAGPSSSIHEMTKIDPWFVAQFAEIHRDAAEGRREGGSHGLEAGGDASPMKRAGFGDAGGRVWPIDASESAVRERRARSGSQAGLQARRHLRGGVRVVHAVSVQLVRADVRIESERPEQGGHSRQRTQSDRPGHRVRLLLLSRGLRVARRGPRDGDDQLQPGNRLDRLRHGRSAVLPAADLRRRDGGDRDGALGGRRRVVPRPVRRADAAQARAGAPAGRRQDSRHVAGFDRSGGRPQTIRGAALEPGDHAAGERHGHLASGSARTSPRRSDSRSWCGRRTSSAAARWRSCTTSARSIAT